MLNDIMACIDPTEFMFGVVLESLSTMIMTNEGLQKLNSWIYVYSSPYFLCDKT